MRHWPSWQSPKSGTDTEGTKKRIEKDKRELPKDVSGFANATGGLLIVGIAEKGDRATGLPGVVISEKIRLSYLERLRDSTTPFISGIEVGLIESPAGDGTGCLLVFVPASADRPHAVVESNMRQLTYFVRDGARVVSLSEAQVAIAYRDRFAGHGDTAEKVREVFEQGSAELDREGRAWLAVAAVPAKAARARHLNRGLLREFKEQTEARQWDLPGPVLSHMAFYGRGRIVLRDTRPGAKAQDHVLHLHSDGSAFAAIALDTAEAQVIIRSNPGLSEDVQCLRVGSITTWAVTLTGITACHAVDAGGSGDLEVRCGIATAVRGADNADASDTHLVPVQHVVAERPWRPMTPEYMISGTAALRELTPFQLPVSAAVVSDWRELVSAAAQMVNELIAEFGDLSDEPLLSEEGFVDGKRCFGALESFGAWAENHQILASQHAE